MSRNVLYLVIGGHRCRRDDTESDNVDSDLIISSSFSCLASVADLAAKAMATAAWVSSGPSWLILVVLLLGRL